MAHEDETVTQKKIKFLRGHKCYLDHPLVLMIVMLPFPPSVWILVLPTTGFPEKAEVGYDVVGSLWGFFVFDGGGVSILWLMSFRVTVPCIPDGFTNVNGRTTDDAIFNGVLMKDFFPEYNKTTMIKIQE